MIAQKRIKIGTRYSRLALTQAEMLAAQLFAKFGTESQLVKIKSSGDSILGPLREVGGKGLFVKELDQAVLNKDIDIALHCAKDIPAFISPKLSLMPVLPRADRRDAFVSNQAKNFSELSLDAVIGTSSLRRQIQLKKINPHYKITDIRGNIDSRLQKLNTEFGAIVLAKAALDRLEIKVGTAIPFNLMLPALTQGILAVSFLRSRDDLTQLFAPSSPLVDATTLIEFGAERSFLETLNADCTTPIGGYSVITNNTIELHVALFNASDNSAITYSARKETKQAAELGAELARLFI